MWPSKWITNEVELQALLARWRGMSSTRTEIWEYSCSHSRLLVRMVRENEDPPFQPVASAYLFCHDCKSVRFDSGWRGVNIFVAKDSKECEQAFVVTEGDRLHVVCGAVLAIETAVIPFVRLADELRWFSLPPGRRVNTLRIEYIMVFVSGETPEQVSRLLDRVTEISTSHEGIISDILREVVIIAFSDLLRGSSMRTKRLTLVEDLSQELPGRLKMVHGVTEQYDGKLEAMFGRLDRLELGQIEELRNDAT